MAAMELQIEWLDVCRRIAARQADLFAATTSISERTVYEGRGEGGDMTLELDRRCEDIVFEELEALISAGGPPLLAISEERGEVRLGDGTANLRVVIDPIDGSMNVRRTLPSHSLSIAVAEGDSMADVRFGFVHDFGAREEFAARLGEGATLNGHPIPVRSGEDPGLEVVGLESADPRWIVPAIEALQGKAYRVRAVGSIAISLSYVAAGRFDAMLSARRCRSVDAAAAQLIVREVGGTTEFAGFPLDDAPLGLDARYAVAAALHPEHLRTVRHAQDAGSATAR
jgi:myo-inositol-1(or 4)-monophosphatase